LPLGTGPTNVSCASRPSVTIRPLTFTRGQAPLSTAHQDSPPPTPHWAPFSWAPPAKTTNNISGSRAPGSTGQRRRLKAFLTFAPLYVTEPSRVSDDFASTCLHPPYSSCGQLENARRRTRSREPGRGLPNSLRTEPGMASRSSGPSPDDRKSS